jgi:DNA-binding transcriptional regulator YiaG
MTTKQRKISTQKASPAVLRRAKKKSRAKLVPAAATHVPAVAALRKSLGVNRRVFARLTGYSERAIAKWETGEKLSGASLQKITEMQRLQAALATVMQAEFVSEWLQAPNSSFDGLKPIEVVERGEIDRLWHMIFELESGMPG